MSDITGKIYHQPPTMPRSLYRVTVDGVEYEATGKTPDGQVVFAKRDEWEKAVRSLGNEMLFVFVDEQQMVPRSEYRGREGEPTQ